MYVRRQALLSIGGFDAKHFPTGYGEETDFCYRALKFGWRNCVTGDVYVEHLEGQSFGERRRKLKEDMVAAMARLHPDYADLEQTILPTGSASFAQETGRPWTVEAALGRREPASGRNSSRKLWDHVRRRSLVGR